MKQSFVMFSWLFKFNMDGAVQEVNARVLRKGWNGSMKMVENLR